MSWLKSDMVAIACILGGAAVGGAATLALADSGSFGDPGCTVDARALSPTIAISHGRRGQAIVVAPDVRVHAVRDCVSDVHEMVEIHLDNRLRHLDAELELLDETLEAQLEGLEAQIEAEVEANLEAAFQIEEAMREVEQAKVKVVLEKVGGGGI
ncbi:MAG: hypothetical protein PVJ76_16150 [Gemmatimonadota bacterium]